MHFLTNLDRKGKYLTFFGNYFQACIFKSGVARLQRNSRNVPRIPCWSINSLLMWLSCCVTDLLQELSWNGVAFTRYNWLLLYYEDHVHFIQSFEGAQSWQVYNEHFGYLSILLKWLGDRYQKGVRELFLKFRVWSRWRYRKTFTFLWCYLPKCINVCCHSHLPRPDTVLIMSFDKHPTETAPCYGVDFLRW